MLNVLPGTDSSSRCLAPMCASAGCLAPILGVVPGTDARFRGVPGTDCPAQIKPSGATAASARHHGAWHRCRYGQARPSTGSSAACAVDQRYQLISAPSTRMFAIR